MGHPNGRTTPLIDQTDGDRNTEGNCAVCAKRDAETGLVCEPCRSWLPRAVASIPIKCADLADELVPADDSTVEPTYLFCRRCGHQVPFTPDRCHAVHPQPEPADEGEIQPEPCPGVVTDWYPRYAIGHAAGHASSLAPDIIISGGGGDPGTPLNLHVHDLLGPVVRDGGRPIDKTGDNWVPDPTLTKRRKRVTLKSGERATVDVLVRRRHMIPAGDQIGVIPIAVALDSEVRAMIDGGAPGSGFRPKSTIRSLCDWIDKRLTWACDQYDGIGGLADQIKYLRGQLMSALGEFEIEEELCVGVPCNRCDLQMLFRRSDGTGDVECHNPACRKIFKRDEYVQIAKLHGAYEKSIRDDDEVYDLLARRHPVGASNLP